MSRVDYMEVVGRAAQDAKAEQDAQKRPLRFIQATISYLPGFYGLQKVQ